MKLFNWTDILSFLDTGNEDSFFVNGTGISVGSFDGLHQGHRLLLNSLVNSCKKNKLKSGILTFVRPLPSIKHSEDYKGDVSTLNQRLKFFEELGIDFVILVNFDDSFASMMGSDFLNVLFNACNMELLAEGIDFRCGYKGATDAQAIKYWAEKNKVQCLFVDPVFYREGSDEEERISSSYIRQMIQKGFFATVEELLERPYELDLSQCQDNASNSFLQVLPPDGIYRTKSENDESVRLEIKNGKIEKLPHCKTLRFV
ncbi:MAG: FAD synthetase family protein [Treponema sp.]|nr:FAD synthetase family protein [Treponema sp.]